VNASSPFTNDRYDEESYAEAEGTELSRVHITRTNSPIGEFVRDIRRNSPNVARS
jgi:hypothetical protein